MQKRLLSNSKIVSDSSNLCQWQRLIVHKTILWNTVAVECQGDGDLLNNLRIKNVLSGEERNLPVNGLFYAIGKLVWLSGDQYALRRMDRTRACDGTGQGSIADRRGWIHYHCPGHDTNLCQRRICGR